MGSVGMPELVIILFIVILIFGANRLPQLATGIGKSIRNFKDGMKDGEKKRHLAPSLLPLAAARPLLATLRRPPLFLFRPRLAVPRPAPPLISPYCLENLDES